MARQSPEYLDRPEPARISQREFKFRQQKTGTAEKEAGLFQGGCLARDIKKAKGFNSNAEAIRSACTYGEKRINENGTIERLVGCMSCGAMCTIVSSERKEVGPGTEDDPNVLISVAEAPQPNPWTELGTFDDCKIGVVKVPSEAPALTKPVGLDQDQRMIAKLLAGHID